MATPEGIKQTSPDFWDFIYSDPLGPVYKLAQQGIIPPSEPLQTTLQNFFSLAQANGEILILTNHLTLAGFASEELLKLFQDRLQRGSSLDIIFHQSGIPTLSSAREYIAKTLPQFSQLQETYLDRININWLNPRIRTPFSIIDQKHSLNITSDQPDDSKPAIFITYHNKKWAKRLKGVFESVAQKTSSV